MIWLDAQLSPKVAAWIREHLNLDASSAHELGLLYATDQEIFEKARDSNAIVMTKDADFVQLLERHGPPPKVIWLTCGNTANIKLKEILAVHLLTACNLLNGADELVEIGEI